MPCREIENLLPPEIIQSIITHYEVRKSPEFTFPIRFELSDYRERELGDFIHSEIFKDSPPKRLGGYKAVSGTLKSNVKDDLCEKSLPQISWGNMSPDAKRLVRALYHFILSIKFPGQDFQHLPLDVPLAETVNSAETIEEVM